MRAYVIERNLKSLDELAGCLRDDAPEPKPSKDEVLVDVHCAGLNFFDILQVQGKYQTKPPFPYVPGAEFSGVISKDSPIPRGCHFEPGKTRVLGAAQGAYGEKVAADWNKLIEVPESLSDEASAGVFITYPTSYAALVQRAQLQEGEWCLVHAGAGGVGLAAVQIAKAVGARVIATASTEDKLAVIRREGGLDEGDHTLLYNDDDWQDKVKKITGKKLVQVVYDPVGLLNKSLKVAGWNSRLIVVGFAAGQIEKIPANLLLLKQASVMGVFWGATAGHDMNAVFDCWANLLNLIDEGKLRPAVFERIYNGLEELPQGLDDLSKRRTWGKAVLRIQPKAKSSGREAKL